MPTSEPFEPYNAKLRAFRALGADYMGELSRLSELTRFAELTRFLLVFPIISTLRLHGKRVVPLRRDPG